MYREKLCRPKEFFVPEPVPPGRVDSTLLVDRVRQATIQILTQPMTRHLRRGVLIFKELASSATILGYLFARGTPDPIVSSAGTSTSV